MVYDIYDQIWYDQTCYDMIRVRYVIRFDMIRYMNRSDMIWSDMIYTAHKKFMNTSTSAESVASFILEGRYLENQTT